MYRSLQYFIKEDLKNNPTFNCLRDLCQFCLGFFFKVMSYLKGLEGLINLCTHSILYLPTSTLLPQSTALFFISYLSELSFLPANLLQCPFIMQEIKCASSVSDGSMPSSVTAPGYVRNCSLAFKKCLGLFLLQFSNFFYLVKYS